MQQGYEMIGISLEIFISEITKTAVYETEILLGYFLILAFIIVKTIFFQDKQDQFQSLLNYDTSGAVSLTGACPPSYLLAEGGDTINTITGKIRISLILTNKPAANATIMRRSHRVSFPAGERGGTHAGTGSSCRLGFQPG